jgi:hypothetical protein
VCLQGYDGGQRRAVDLVPTHALGHYALAAVYFFRKEKVPFRVEAERALSLNPYDAGAKAYTGLLIACAGEWDRGCEMVESAMQMNPNCPGYFYFARCWGSYRLNKYEETLKALASANMPTSMCRRSKRRHLASSGGTRKREGRYRIC